VAFFFAADILITNGFATDFLVPFRFNIFKSPLPESRAPASVAPAPPPTPSGATASGEERRTGFSIRRLAPLVVLATAIVLFFAFGLHQHFSFAALRDNQADLLAFVSRSWLLAALLFMAVYATTTALSLPWGALLTLAGGFLFGPLLGGLLSVIGATAGAFLLFTIAKSALGDPLRARAERSLKLGAWQRIETGFQANAFSYMLFLRLVPVFPFFIINLVPAFLGVRPRTYLLATLLGIIPGTLIYSIVGSGLGKIFEQGEAFSLDSVLTAEIIAGLAALALLSMIPVGHKYWRRRAAL
jgi:uncharacterized membrane protein YdjX (TVP38/TMEM64 family)